MEVVPHCMSQAPSSFRSNPPRQCFRSPSSRWYWWSVLRLLTKFLHVRHSQLAGLKQKHRQSRPVLLPRMTSSLPRLVLQHRPVRLVSVDKIPGFATAHWSTPQVVAATPAGESNGTPVCVSSNPVFDEPRCSSKRPGTCCTSGDPEDQRNIFYTGAGIDAFAQSIRVPPRPAGSS